jgi:transcriptional regulator with XRE-family HTH domain
MKRNKAPVGDEPQDYTAQDLAAIRRARNWTTYDLGQYLGCNQSTVWRMESGKVPIKPGVRRLLDRLEPVAQEAA